MGSNRQTKAGIIFDRILGVLFIMACVLLAVDMFVMSADVVTRYFAWHPIKWSIDVVSFSLLYITFMGTAWVLRDDRHVKIDLIFDLLSPRVQAAVNIVTSVLGAIMCAVLSLYSGRLTWSMFQSGEFYPSYIEPPKAVLVGIITVGSFLLFIQFLRRAYRYVIVWKVRTTTKRKVTDL